MGTGPRNGDATHNKQYLSALRRKFDLPLSETRHDVCSVPKFVRRDERGAGTAVVLEKFIRPSEQFRNRVAERADRFPCLHGSKIKGTGARTNFGTIGPPARSLPLLSRAAPPRSGWPWRLQGSSSASSIFFTHRCADNARPQKHPFRRIAFKDDDWRP
jgi:hypothetical protein